MSKLYLAIRELRRRRVFRAAGFYLVGAWGLLQVGDVIVEPAGLPDWSMTALLYLLVLGFPIAVFLGWRYEFGEHGLVRTAQVSDEAVEAADLHLRPIDYATFGALLLIVGGVIYQVLPSLRSESEATREAAEAARIAQENSVAVLPFIDLSPDADHAYLAAGLSDTVLHLLSQVHGLSVTARTSSFAFKDKGMDVAGIAEALNVGNVLEGSVQRAGDQVRIIARLIDADSGSERWSGNFDRELSGIFEIQDEIAREVVTAMKVTVMDDEQDRLDDSYRPNLEAYEQYVLGRSELLRESARSSEAAQAHFEQAIELDPDYALPYVGLAQAYFLQSQTRGRPVMEAVQLSEPLLEQALDLDPLTAEAYGELARIRFMNKDWEAAETYVLRAIELNPSSAEAHHGYGQMLWVQGRKEESLVQTRKAAELDPQSAQIQQALADVLWSLARSEEALGVLRDGVARDPELGSNYERLATYLKRLGRAGESMYYISALHRIEPDNYRWWQLYCEEHAQLWDFDAAIGCFEELIAAFPEPREGRKWLAALQGDFEEAARLGELDVAERPQSWYPKAQLAYYLAQLDQWERIVEMFRDVFPELYQQEPQVTDWSIWPARLIAQGLLETGQQEEADRLLAALRAKVERSRKLQAGGWASGIEDAQIYSLQGETDRALAALARAVDSGWMSYSYTIETDPSLTPIKSDPRYEEIRQRLLDHLARERAWYEEHKDDPLEVTI